MSSFPNTLTTEATSLASNGAKVRVLQVGCGGITGSWFPNALKHSDIEYVGLVDLNPDAARGRRDEFGLAPDTPIFTDVKTALAETQPDAIFDCTIPQAHTSTALAAFEAGAHVLSEKPMSDSLENARLALDAAQDAGKIYAITQNYRYAPGPRRLKAFLESGAIGAVTTINADMYIGPHFGGFRDQMQHVLLLDMAIHTFDMGRFLGGGDPLAVFCHEWNPQGSWYAHGASASAIFEMSEGMVFNFRGSWCSNGLPTGFNSAWRIQGEKGAVAWDGGENYHVEVVTGEEGWLYPVGPVEVPQGDFGFKAGGHGGVIREFLDAVKGAGAAPETRAQDNIKSLNMVLGAVASAESGTKIRLSS